jgi:hypothetical protein
MRPEPDFSSKVTLKSFLGRRVANCGSEELRKSHPSDQPNGRTPFIAMIELESCHQDCSADEFFGTAVTRKLCAARRGLPRGSRRLLSSTRFQSSSENVGYFPWLKRSRLIHSCTCVRRRWRIARSMAAAPIPIRTVRCSAHWPLPPMRSESSRACLANRLRRRGPRDRDQR